MCSQTGTRRSTADCSPQIDRLREELDRAQAVVVGAGSGLSAADGFDYAGARFQTHFADFIAKYQFKDMYSAGFYPYESPEEFWAFWSRHILLNRYKQQPGGVYEDLKKALQGKDWFVLTTNVDHCFQRAGFDKQRLFYTQGDYGLWQCQVPCHMKTYDNEDIVRQMAVQQSGLRVPSDLVPLCPNCGAAMTNNLRCDDRFVQDEGWHAAAGRYEGFLQRHEDRRILLLELGVGGNTPGIIKHPFWMMAHNNKNARYACLNLHEAVAPKELSGRSLCIQTDLKQALAVLVKQEEQATNRTN